MKYEGVGGGPGGEAYLPRQELQLPKIRDPRNPHTGAPTSPLRSLTYAPLFTMDQASEKPNAPMASGTSPNGDSPSAERKRKWEGGDRSPNDNRHERRGRDSRDSRRGGRGRGGKPLQHGSNSHKKRSMGRKDHL